MLLRLWRAEPLLTAVVFGATVLMCGAFAILLSYSDADWFTYSNIARNLVSGCGVAISFSGTCEPHFGGAHLPLYPTWVALLWLAFGESEGVVRAANVVAFALANVVLSRAVLTATGARLPAYAVGLLVALSPLTARWFGTLLTEPLALATTTLVGAELLLILALQRLRLAILSMLVVLAVWVRLDGVLLLAPTAVALWLALGWRRAIPAMIVVVAAVGLTAGAWSLRSLHVGIRPFPTAWMLPDGSLGPFGYQAWLKTWIVTEDARGRASYFAIDQYRRIDIDDAAFQRFDDRAEVQQLLTQLRAAEGRPFPAEIDTAFARLAQARLAQFSSADHAGLLARRTWDMAGPWILPLLKTDGTWTMRIPAGSMLRTAYFWSFAIATIIAWRQRASLGRHLCTVAATLFLARALFFAAGMGLEARYMIEAVPLLSCVIGVYLIAPALQALWHRQQARRRRPA